jgi:nucleoside 2-deoxyribosyltransferase
MSAMPSKMRIPAEISESIKRFRRDFPSPQKVAFIMMRYGKTKAHNEIVSGLGSELAKHGIEAVRADQKEYHDDLFWNILTYLHGCDFGIAVFERIELEEFNPNVALEVGYLMALKKPILLLKDHTLRNLTTDLIGKLYKTFDPQPISGSLGPEVNRWLKDKGLIKSEKEQKMEALALSEFVVNPYCQLFSRHSGKSLDELFTAFKESTSLGDFTARCFPEKGRRKPFLEAFRHPADQETFLRQANAMRDRLNLTAYPSSTQPRS